MKKDYFSVVPHFTDAHGNSADLNYRYTKMLFCSMLLYIRHECIYDTEHDTKKTKKREKKVGCVKTEGKMWHLFDESVSSNFWK